MKLHVRPSPKLLGLPYEATVTVIYLISALMWIFFSDYALNVLAENPEKVIEIQTYKGFAYVVATALILYYALHHIFQRFRKIQDDLKTSEERYRMLVENHSDMVVKMDADGRLLYVNSSYCEMFAKSEDSLLGNSFISLVHEDDLVATEEVMKALCGPPYTADLEQRSLTKAGWRWISWHNTAVLDENGEVKEIIGVGRDITERRDAEAVYHANSDRLRLAAAISHIGVWEYDYKHDNLIWDNQMFEMYEVDKSTFSGKFESWQKSVHPDDLKHAENELKEANAEGKLFECEFRIIGRHKQIKHVRALAEIERDSSGNPVRAIGINRDVTKHRNMVDALTASERNYHQLFENMTTGFMMVEVIADSSGSLEDFKVVQINKTVCKMIGTARENVLGRTLKTILHPLEEYWLDALSQVAKTGQAISYENRIQALELEVVARIFVPKPGYLGIIISDITARRAAEDAVLLARQQLQHILDNTRDGIWQIDLKGNFVFANSAAEELTGYSVDQILKMNMLDLITPDFHDMVRGRIAKRIAGNPNEDHYSFTICCADGSLKWLELSTNADLNAEGKLKGIQGTARDVTARKKVELELQESRHFLRTIIDTIPLQVFWKDTESAYLGCNLAFARDFGVETPDDLIGKTDYDTSVFSEDADRYHAEDKEIMANMIERIGCEELYRGVDGKPHWLSTSKVPLCDASGNVIGVLGACQDITERKLLEEERKRLSTAINQSAEAIVIMDLEGFIQYINPAFVVVTGYDEDEAVGANLSIINGGRHDELFYRTIWKTIQSGQSWNGRMINKHKNGSNYTVEAAFSPVKDATNEIVSYVVAIRDVSEQVELEEHIRQTQKMDAVGRLAGGIAHDFNNILQSILGFSGILLNEMKAGTSQYNDVSEIKKAAHRARDLTRQLLALSRKESVEYSAQNLNTIILKNEQMMRRLIGEQIEFVFNLDPELKTVCTDSNQIEQIILNLFINARDAMPQGGVLKIKTYNVPEPSTGKHIGPGDVCLEVADTGCGIRADVLKRMFEPFYTTKKIGEGTGLGLSVVYGIVKQHDGRIEVGGQVGEGAILSVYLPASDLKEAMSSNNELDEKLVLPLEGNNEKILVVEDDVEVRKLTHRMLRDAGYSVTAVADISEATIALNETQFDLLLVDIVLPDGSGVDLVQDFRAKGGNFAVLLCSGYSHSPDVHDAMNINGFQYLEKPIGSMKLLQSVREMLDENRIV